MGCPGTASRPSVIDAASSGNAARVQIYLALLPVQRDTLFLIPTRRGKGVPG